MALQPITVGLVALGYGLYSKSRHHRKIRRPSKTGPVRPATIPKTSLEIAADCSSWDMPELWIIQTAQSRFRTKLDEALLATRGDIAKAKAQGRLDPVALTYAVLHEEIGHCPAPLVHTEDGTTLTFRELQAEIPQHPDYYPHPAILGLFDTIYEAVEAALLVLEQTRDPARALLFPA
ncbi:MAG: hypothetical protein KDK70_18640 [Myxococcales bacterium]|nr:hypothetical protein [Myxococcales bacterium]